MTRYWLDDAMEKAMSEFSLAKEAMRATLRRPILRQPNIRDQLFAALAEPQSTDLRGRQRLAGFLQERYGEQARNVLPYLLGDETEESL